MRTGKLRQILYAAIFLILLTLSTACTGDFALTPAAMQRARSMPVDPIFNEFYDTLGGEELLGPAISPIETHNNLQCQFTERVLMCFNPLAKDTSRFRLYPLGLELKIQEDSHLSSITALPDSRVIDGTVVYEKFLPLYDRLYGARYVGRPLTELRINQDLHRAEQFFENAGFYQDLNDPNGSVYLIPYGAYLCGGNCSYHLDEYWSIVKSNLAEQPFAPSITRLGGPSVFGSLLLQPRTAEEGSIEQVYTNAVFYAPQNDLSQVRLRPLPIILGYEVQPLVEMKSHEQLVFYEIKDGLGHNVPRPFDNFVASHGGRDVSGQPISEVFLLQDQNIYQQCFENYCLLYDPSAVDVMKVRMAPLGEEYIQKFPPAENIQIRNIFSPDTISLIISADKPNINPSEPQFIRAMIRQKDTGKPLERVEASLVLSYPDRPSARFFMPPSDASGMTVLEIAPQPDLPNGSHLSYQVCLNLPSEKPICALDSYLIWSIGE